MSLTDIRRAAGLPVKERKKRKPNPNFCGKKGRSGRKSDIEILKKYINSGYAHDIANEELKKLRKKKDRTIDEIKTLVMPVVLKDMADKKQIDAQLNITFDQAFYDITPETKGDNSKQVQVQDNTSGSERGKDSLGDRGHGLLSGESTRPTDILHSTNPDTSKGHCVELPKKESGEYRESERKSFGDDPTDN